MSNQATLAATGVNRRAFLSLAAATGMSYAMPGLAPARAQVNALANAPIRIAFPTDSPPYSWYQDGECMGLLPDLVRAMATLSNFNQVGCQILPRKRAILQMEREEIDGFCTYPAGKIRDVAYFMSRPLVEADYGYIVYNKTLKEAGKIQQAKNFGDLRPFPFFAQRASGWEEENVPDFIDNKYVTDPKRALGLLLARNQPGFMILPKGQAVYLARDAGLTHKMGIKRAPFIPNNILPYHISIRQDFADAASIVVGMDKLLQHPQWLDKKNAVLQRYASL